MTAPRLPPAAGLVVLGKLVLHPLAVAAALALAPGMPTDLALAGTIIAAVPMLSIFGLLGQRWGAPDLAATAMLLTTVLSFATVSALLSLILPG